MCGLSVGWGVSGRVWHEGWTSCVWRGVRESVRGFRTAGTWMETVPDESSSGGMGFWAVVIESFNVPEYRVSVSCMHK